MLSGIGCLVMPQSLAVPNAADAFADDGSFKEDSLSKRAARVAERIVHTVDKFNR